MTTSSLPELLSLLHQDIERRLDAARRAIGHPGTKGDLSESVWLDLLKNYLPARYTAERAFVVDSDNRFSQQLDVVIFDRQYSPFIFRIEDQCIIPAESVYAAFEAKQTLNAANIDYAQKKVASVRVLHRTSLPIPYADGVYPAKTPPHILGGILTLDSEWSPPLGASALTALGRDHDTGVLDLGCVASYGTFAIDDQHNHSIQIQSKAATSFLFQFIARLQSSATVPMIDIGAYARWLKD